MLGRAYLVSLLRISTERRPILPGHLRPTESNRKNGYAILQTWFSASGSKRTDVPIPAVIDTWETGISEADDDQGIGYMLMEYIEGRLISDNIWSTLDAHIQRDIHFQLKPKHTTASIYPNGFSWACWWRPPIPQRSLYNQWADPFKSSSDIESWFNERVLVCQDSDRVPLRQPSLTGVWKFGLCLMWALPHGT
ncbi:hypothetical protein GJ744_010786 [Endocarpon pusillum]|uniref:Uncharacterized protein n=1 Tax=Endocarpon pusillum TaxID=364733 RepID=A0A8H7ADQ5_9EURO|nr:hypothetical protein GJ744_010786 [Endocarpon pusillum]